MQGFRAQMDGLRHVEAEERPLAQAEASRDFAAISEAKMRAGRARNMRELDRRDGWGAFGPPMPQALADLREAVRRGPVASRRTPPRARRAAHRPAARRTATRAGPLSDDPDLADPEPASPGASR